MASKVAPTPPGFLRRSRISPGVVRKFSTADLKSLTSEGWNSSKRMYPNPEGNFANITRGASESICRPNLTSNTVPSARWKLAANGVSSEPENAFPRMRSLVTRSEEDGKTCFAPSARRSLIGRPSRAVTIMPGSMPACAALLSGITSSTTTFPST